MRFVFFFSRTRLRRRRHDVRTSSTSQVQRASFELLSALGDGSIVECDADQSW